MKILVCISNVPDTTTKVKFVNNSSLDTTGIQWIINPWDELALTRALQIKEKSGGKVEKVTVITVGKQSTEPTIRKALAIGADDAIRIDSEPTDAFFVASQLAEIIKNDNYDIILCGIESSDYNGSSVGGMLSELLNVPSVSSATALDIVDGQISVSREIDGGKEIVGVPTPFVAIAQKGIAIEPLIASMRGIMMAKTKILKVLPPANKEALTEYLGYSLPQPKSACKMIDPENVKQLITLLHEEAKVI